MASSIQDRLVAKIDPSSNSVVGVIRVGGGPRSVVLLHGDLWVAEFDDATVARVPLA